MCLFQFTRTDTSIHRSRKYFDEISPGVPTAGVIQNINAENDFTFIASDGSIIFYSASNIAQGWPGQVGRCVEFDLV